MSNHSMVDVAYNILTDKTEGVAFSTLWLNIAKELGYNEAVARKKIAQFYSAIMLDKRFVNLGNNVWDLAARYTYDETHFDTSAMEIDDNETEEDEFTDEENSEKSEESNFNIYDDTSEDSY